MLNSVSHGNTRCKHQPFPRNSVWVGDLWLSGKESACQHRRSKRYEFNPWVKKIPWRRKWQSTPIILPGKSHGQRSLVGFGPWDHKRVRYSLATKQQNKGDIYYHKTSSIIGFGGRGKRDEVVNVTRNSEQESPSLVWWYLQHLPCSSRNVVT